MLQRVRGTRIFRSRSKLALLVCAALAFASPAAATAQPAPSADEVTTQATQFNARCETGEFCLYKDSDFGLPVIDYGTSTSDCCPRVMRTCDSTYVNNNFPFTGFPVNDQTSSWRNLSSVTVRIYDDSGYIGHYSDLRPGTQGNLRDVRVGQDDASSHRSIDSRC